MTNLAIDTVLFVTDRMRAALLTALALVLIRLVSGA
jgi:hypothetical protein